jgi:hypothetical protein
VNRPWSLPELRSGRATALVATATAVPTTAAGTTLAGSAGATLTGTPWPARTGSGLKTGLLTRTTPIASRGLPGRDAGFFAVGDKEPLGLHLPQQSGILDAALKAPQKRFLSLSFSK